MCVNNLAQGRTLQCSGRDWTGDLQSQVQRPNHYATEPSCKPGTKFCNSDYDKDDDDDDNDKPLQLP